MIETASLLPSSIPPEYSQKETSSLCTITDTDMVQAIACTGFRDFFDVESLSLEKGYERQYSQSTEAYRLVRNGILHGQNNNIYEVKINRDPHSVGIMVVADDGTIATHVGYRDRRKDGSNEASPPYYLKKYGGLTEGQIPQLSYNLGATNWYYSSQYDIVPDGRRVEFSILASHPDKKIKDRLNNKKGQLYIDPDTMSQFIDDPFAFIPFDHPSHENLNRWWSYWNQVVNRGLRGKFIPYPGQTAMKGFDNFFHHVLQQSKSILKPLGYTHLSGVPTWYYVWHLNMTNGFVADDFELHQQAIDFFKILNTLELPDFAKQYLNASTLGELDSRSPLKSWFSATPYILALDPSFIPNVQIGNETYEERFLHTFEGTHKAFIQPDRIAMYPLLPGRNVWHSLTL